jgi:hypothetical protein
MSQIIEFCPPTRFDRIEVCGTYFPSLDSINLILKRIDNKKTRINFIVSNNKTVAIIELMCNLKDDADYIYRELFVELKHNYQRQAEVIRVNVSDVLWQSLYIVNWFAAMVAKPKPGNRQGLKREASKKFDLFNNIGVVQFEDADENHLLRHPDLKEFPEYVAATQFISEWYTKASTLSNDNPELRKLIISEKQLIKQIHEEIENSTNKGIKICQFCGKLFFSNRSGIVKACDSPKCDRKYHKQWEKLPGRDPVGWKVAFKGESKSCKGKECVYEERGHRQVNRQYICRTCFANPLWETPSSPVK